MEGSRRHKERQSLNADLYGTQAANVAAPKLRMPTEEMRADVAFALVRDELFLDGNAGQNLATFCQTWLDPEVHQLMDLSLNKNMIDKDEYPATAELESRCVHILADLWRSPHAADTAGCSTTGSSEACMLGGLALKWNWRKRMLAAGKPADKPNLVTGPVQVCWHKFARYFDVELREIPLERAGGNFDCADGEFHICEYGGTEALGGGETAGVHLYALWQPDAFGCGEKDCGAGGRRGGDRDGFGDGGDFQRAAIGAENRR